MRDYLILIIDDDPNQHLILGDYLKLAGYEVIHAEDGVQGLEKIKENKPDLVVMDVHMPELDGFQALKTIRKNAAYRNVSVLLVTALARQHLKIKGLELGADDYITKPFDRAEVLARINAVLRRSDRTHRLEGVMAGDLSDVGLGDLLQSMELGSKTAVIKLKEIDGEIIIENGELVSARQGVFTGTDALIRAFLIEKGHFSIKFNDIPEYSTEERQPLTSVLMNILCEVDEIRDIVKRLKIEERIIIAVADLSEFPSLDKIKHLMPLRVMNAVVSLNGAPKENLKTLITAAKKRKIRIKTY